MWQFRVLTAIDGDIFPARKPSLWDDCFQSASETLGVTVTLSPSKLLYNSALRVECSRIPYENLVEDTCKRCPGYRDACKLGNLWLRQRAYQSGINAGGFGPSEFTTLMSLLLAGGGSTKRPVLSVGHDEFQLFKGVLRYLATRDLMAKPAVFGDDLDPRLQGLCTTPILYDAIRGLNILYKMSPWSYRSVCLDLHNR